MHRVNNINYATAAEAAANINPLPEVTLRSLQKVVRCLVCETEVRSLRYLPTTCPVCAVPLGPSAPAEGA